MRASAVVSGVGRRKRGSTGIVWRSFVATRSTAALAPNSIHRSTRRAPMSMTTLPNLSVRVRLTGGVHAVDGERPVASALRAVDRGRDDDQPLP